MEQSSTPTAVGSNAGLGVITRAEWERRYAERGRERAGLTHAEADEFARALAQL